MRTLDPVAYITVKYSCDECGISKREVQVKARGDEDVVTWMRQTCITALALDHSITSPHCCAETLTETWIPVSGADKIGSVIKN